MQTIESLLGAVADPVGLAGFTPSDTWAGRETDLEGGLEGWVEAIARLDPRAGVLAALACAEHALPIAASSAATSEDPIGGPDESWGDAPPAREQIAAARRWLDGGTPIPPHTADYSRQLDVWDEDLRPPSESPEGWYLYLVESANLLVMAILHDAEAGPYGTWAAPVCAARSAVCSYKAMHRRDADRVGDAAALIASIKTALA